ncbi:MAG: APC family permease, partial [Gammaproteobacteria bacterium]
NWHSLAFLTAILFSLVGMEMSAVHAEEVKNPQKDYPRALFYSTIIILTSLTLASLAIAIVVPQAKISLVSGLINAFSIFFHTYHLAWIIPIISIAMLIGSLGGISAWIIGPTKGLLVASYDGTIPPIFHSVNQYGVPVALLITQAIIVTILSTVFLLMPTVNTSYWLLSALTSQLALLFYIFLFSAAIKLRYSKPDQPRAYKIPGGKLGMCLVSGVAILTCIVVATFGFLPASNITTGNILFYEGFLIGGIIVFCGIPLIIYYFHNPSWINES